MGPVKRVIMVITKLSDEDLCDYRKMEISIPDDYIQPVQGSNDDIKDY